MYILNLILWKLDELGLTYYMIKVFKTFSYLSNLNTI